MSKPQIHAIWKTADILADSISRELKFFLNQYGADFTAATDDYNIFNINGILEGEEISEYGEEVSKELEAIQKVISKKGCSYFRIVG